MGASAIPDTAAPSWIPQGGAPARLTAARTVVALLATAACVIGMLPAVLYLQSGRLVWYAVGATLLVSLVTVRTLRPTHLDPPRKTETVAAFLATISQGALASAVTLVIYLLVHGLFVVVSLVLSWFDVTLSFAWRPLAFGVAAAFGGFILLGVVPLATEGLMQLLFPPLAGSGTPFRRSLRTARGRAVLALGVIATVGFTWFAFAWPLDRLGEWGCLGIAYLVLFATIVPWDMAQKASKPRAFTSSEEALAVVFRAMGFSVVEQPRTGLSAVDPFLADLDFVITRERSVFAVLVRTRREAGQDDLQDVSRVAFAAHALSGAATKEDPTSPRVRPLLVIAGGTPGVTQLAFARQQGVALAVVADDAALSRLAGDADAARRFGTEVFDAPLREEAAETTGAMPDENVGQYTLAPQQRWSSRA